MDASTGREIDRAVADLLRDVRVVEPPVPIERLLDHLRLHRDYYDLEDPGLLRRAQYRLKLEGTQLFRLIRDKVRLAAVWLPDENRILIDSSLHKAKKNWAAFHDTTHRLLPWHRPFFLGDTAQTLQPDFHEQLEAEANCGASALIFCGDRFTRESLDTVAEWASVDLLRKRYSASLASTLRRYVEHGHDLPMMMAVSAPWWEDVPENQVDRCRHLVPSERFLKEFGAVPRAAIVDCIQSNTAWRKGGPVGEFEICLEDRRGEPHEFRGENFYNSFDVLTLITYNVRLSARRFVVNP